MNWPMNRRQTLILWQFLFIILSTSWLWAPHLNHTISSRVSLISQYEVGTQPYSWLFRIGDITGALLVVGMAYFFLKKLKRSLPGTLLLIIGIGLAIDSIVPTTCSMVGNMCVEHVSASFIIHAIETVVTAAALFALSCYDVKVRRLWASVGFVFFQIVYGGLFLTQLANQDSFSTLSQFVYQTIMVVWLAWFCRDYIIQSKQATSSPGKSWLVRNGLAIWVFTNGVLAILVSLADIQVLGKVKALYFAGDTAWLAQHSVVIGLMMLYLSRHISRGERRARQIMLFIFGVEVLKYSLIVPQPALMGLYLLNFCVLFVSAGYFNRNTAARTLQIRLKDALFMLGALVTVMLIGLAVLYHTQELSDITTGSIDHFFDYTLRQTFTSRHHLQSALLAHTLSVFLTVGAGTLLWSLFRPSGILPDTHNDGDAKDARRLLAKYASNPDDYFKLWPADKEYFWAKNGNGFIAYKISGSVLFALADPIATRTSTEKLIQEFLAWARSVGLRVCFLPVQQTSKKLYDATHLNSLQIGSNALINRRQFLDTTSGNKWWRWKKNRALKNNYSYFVSEAPHSANFLQRLEEVSLAWLGEGGRKERGFALGYFDKNYLQQCRIHYLEDAEGKVVAFTNQLPACKPSTIASVDLLRFLPGADDTMPYLLYKTIESLGDYSTFDLGFVPFASTDKLTLKVAQVISAGLFSAKGLEQFKNKFGPDWQPVFLAYDGSLSDLSLVAANLEKVMRVSANS